MKLSKYIEVARGTSGNQNSQESKNASRAIKRELIKGIPGAEIDHHTGHFYASGFVRVGNTVVYYSTGDFRGSSSSYIRYAKDEKDFTGEINHAINIDDMTGLIQKLLNQRRA